MAAADLGIDGRRFWATVMRSGEIGPGKAGGLRRLALSDADKEMRDLFVTWCTETGCTVAVDRVGNIFARRPGTDDHLPPVLRKQTVTRIQPVCSLPSGPGPPHFSR